MPKGKRKERNGRKTENLNHSSEDEVDAADTVSAVSSLSEAVATDGSEDVETDESSAQENFEDKLKACIEGTSQKSAKGRVDSLTSLRAALSKKYIFDFVSHRKVTIGDCLERCIKKGKGDEQAAAAMCSVLLVIQLGMSEEREEIFKTFLPILKVIVADSSSSCLARSACAEALGLCTFVAAEEIEDIVDAMKALENVFKQSYQKGDGVAPNHVPDVITMHNSALSAWTLLLSILSPSVIRSFHDSHLSRLPEMLSSSDIELRISAGEAIALFYELARDEDEEFEEEGFDELCTRLKSLSTECNKYRAKKDRRQQKSSFRDILGAVEKGDFPKMRIKVNAFDTVVIDSWSTKMQYNALCHVLGTGMNIHLQENELLRDIFGLGPPIPIGSLPSGKASKVERNHVHDAAFKARTKNRSKLRDKKAVFACGE